MSDAALSENPTDHEGELGLSEEGRKTIQGWLDSGAFEDALLRVDMDELEAQRLELEHRLRGRDEARLPSTE